MARINLLPWREEYRQEKKKQFLTQLLFVCILAATIAFVWIKAVDSAIESQQGRNNVLKNEISKLEEQVKEIQDLKKRRQELLDRMKVIQDLQGTRPVIVRYFDEFTRAVPDGVYITLMKRNGNLLEIEGVSESNNRVSEFMRRLDGSEFFADSNLKSVRAAEDLGGQSDKFSLQVKMILPAEEKASG